MTEFKVDSTQKKKNKETKFDEKHTRQEVGQCNAK